MRLNQLLSTLLITILFTGCGEPKADISTPKTHSSGAITLDYPKNWKITEESITSEMHSFFIETNGNALVIFQSYPSEDADDLPAFSKSFSDAATETPVGKVAGATFAGAPDKDGYEWILEDYTINLLGESIPHRRRYGAKNIGDKRIFLIFQVASEDSAKVESGFQLIQKSLRGNQTAEQAAPSNGG
jgi:hypothetical protein